ncbi:PIN domain-containing protein [Candidatus Oleimmundimicrobium sp.]|uniref:PIN domain-containing protein n=1 Tax=Candidatus Oleimmundimicrobium sp. TaxID=3060597 RepID=UPI002721AEE7|nr:PIN domain-containing protein [Candidatus Oleimmundimicrobium sp.]MDO8885680.1 PIN domain-containing protein [Candidatus Oleimmundimicrobium sp.]
MKHIFVLDTNVLLEDPDIIYSFTEAEVIIPETVLSEIDKLKMAHVSSDIKHHGREVSRNLFNLSEKGKLSDGVQIKNGTTIKIATLEPFPEVPKSLNLKITDDRILAITYQIHKKNPNRVILITSDLNMLLKAQTLGINTQHKETSSKKGFVLFKKPMWKVILPWVLVVLLVLTIFTILYLGGFPPSQKPSSAPPEVTSEQEIYQSKKNECLKALEDNPNDLQALVGLGNLYFDNKQYQLAINMYQRSLEIQSNNTNVRTDLGIAYFYLGMNDAAIREFQEVIKIDPNHPNAHFNLGIVFWRGKNDLKNALKEFERYLELLPEGPSAEEAKQNITQIKTTIENSGDKNE